MLDIQEKKPLSDLTTFKIGGPARYFVEVGNEEEIREALVWARANNQQFIVLGGGSNVLIPDEGLNALVIHITSQCFSFPDIMNDIGCRSLEAQAGCNLLSLIRKAGEEGLGGWEKLGGIPGTIGGAVRGNAGAFGPEIKDFITWVRAMNTKTEEVHEFSNAECEFAYRMSYFKRHPEWIILDVHLQLEKIDSAQSARAVDATIAEREKRHIQNVRAAGSYFMNPVAPQAVVALFEEEKKTTSRGSRVPAGWLIEKAGMKGVCVGDACSSKQHPNYLVNMGNAKAEEVLELAQKIKGSVKSQFGVELEEEAAVLGKR